MSRCNFYLYGPAVPGAIAPVDATDLMTNPVGIKRCRLYVDAPTTDDMSALESRVETLEEGSTGSGGNSYVCVTDQNTCFNDMYSLTYTTLPENAKLDKITIVASLNNGNNITEINAYVTANNRAVACNEVGDVCYFTLDTGTSGDITITTLTIESGQDLFTHTPTASDTIIYARIYYHV